MKYAYFILKRKGYYLEKYESEEMCLLGLFLDIDVGNNTNSFREFLDDPWARFTSSNYCYIGKIGEKVTIGCSMEWGEPDDEPFETTRDDLHYVFDRWDELLKQEVEEIIITRVDDDKLLVEGKKQKLKPVISNFEADS